MSISFSTPPTVKSVICFAQSEGSDAVEKHIEKELSAS